MPGATGLNAGKLFAHALPASATKSSLAGSIDAATTATDWLRLDEAYRQPLKAATLKGVLAWLAAAQGKEERCRELATQSVRGFARTDNPTGGTWAEWALALVDLGAGRWDAAFDRLETTARTPGTARSHSSTLPLTRSRRRRGWASRAGPRRR